MRIIDYSYIKPTERRPGYIAIPELKRDKPSAIQFVKLAKLDVNLTRPTAFLYITGVSMAPSEFGLNTHNTVSQCPVVKSTAAFSAHEWIYTFKNKEHLIHVDSISGTCAAGIQAVSKAYDLLYSNAVDEVIIIGGDRITLETLRLFKELNIPITCGDGFVYMRLDRGSKQITDVKWKYQFNRNPFVFTEETINKLSPGYPVDYVKLHGTGTEVNTAAELGLSKLGRNLTYKSLIGHTQGVSALLETCLVLDDHSITGTTLVTANGLGGFYGCFTLKK
jgi:hypothetical protein